MGRGMVADAILDETRASAGKGVLSMQVHLFVIFYTALAVLLVLGAILYVVGKWTVFSRMGERGWKSLVPVYDVFVLYAVSGSMALFPLLVVCLGAFAFLASSSEQVLLAIQWVPLAVAFVPHAIQCVRLARIFRRGRAFSVGLVLLTPFFLAAMGLGLGERPYEDLYDEEGHPLWEPEDDEPWDQERER